MRVLSADVELNPDGQDWLDQFWRDEGMHDASRNSTSNVVPPPASNLLTFRINGREVTGIVTQYKLHDEWYLLAQVEGHNLPLDIVMDPDTSWFVVPFTCLPGEEDWCVPKSILMFDLDQDSNGMAHPVLIGHVHNMEAYAPLPLPVAP